MLSFATGARGRGSSVPHALRVTDRRTGLRMVIVEDVTLCNARNIFAHFAL
jgi:hypothetical protein